MADKSTLESPALTGGVHIPPLDGVRGLAILAVMARHFTQGMNFDASRIDRAVYKAAQLGSNGVDLFFVLSGFLITGILLDTKARAGYFRRFYTRRTLRIFPLYYAALAIVFFVWPLFSHERSHTIQEAAGYQAWYWTYTANILFAIKQDYMGMAHFWSLAVEEQFYLFWPVVVLLLSRRALIQTCGILIATTIALRGYFAWLDTSTIVPYVLTPTRMDSLAIGAAIAAIARGPTGLRKLAPHAWWIAPACVTILAALLSTQSMSGRTQSLNLFGATLVGLFCGGAMVIALNAPRSSLLSRALSVGPLSFFGRYAYCLYIVHPFVQELIQQHYSDDMLPRIGVSYLPGRAVFMLLCTGASVAIALASWHLYEKQWLKLKWIGG